MMNTHVKLIYNPYAGKGAAAEKLPQVEALLKERKIGYTLFVTQAVGHAIALARDAAAEGYGLVIAAGGDGTINEVVNGLMLSGTSMNDRPTLGILTVGRGNDFSYGADIPSPVEDCIAAIAKAVSRPLDIGRIAGGDYPQGRYFANGIGAGFDTIVGLEAAKMKHVHGGAAYIFGALRTLLIFPEPPYVTLSAEGIPSKVIEQPSTQISILNGRRMGGSFYMAPRASNFDGLLDLCMAAKLTRLDMIRLIAEYTKGTQYRHPKIATARAAGFAIRAPEGGLVVHADGETITTNGTSLDISCCPSAIRIIYDEAVAAQRKMEFAEIPEPARMLP